MALFDDNSPSTLEDVLGQQAATKAAGIQDQYTQQKKKLVSQQAASGRLLSPTSNYNFGDLGASEASDLGGVYSDLAGALGSIPAEDQLNQDAYGRSLELAKLIGGLNKPSTLQEVLGGLRTAGGIAGTVAAFG